MAYFIFKSNDSSTPFAIINEQTFDNTSTSLTLVGRRRVDYGQSQQQNQLWLLENFASPNQPSNAVIGQLWMDTSTNTIKVFTGGNFVRVANANIGSTLPSNPEGGQMFFNTTTQKFNVYNGTQFVEIGPSDEAIPFAIVFGA